MKPPYGYVLVGEEIVVHEEKVDVVRSILEHYLAGDSLGKIVDVLFTKGTSSPTKNPRWTRAVVDKLLANSHRWCESIFDTQFKKNRRCNVDCDKAGHPRKND